MNDWSHNLNILIQDSEPLIRSLLVENCSRGDEIVSIGYVFEFGRGQLEFDLCANTSRNQTAALESLGMNFTEGTKDYVRWNSGDFDFPAGVSDLFGGFSEEWYDELIRINQLAETESNRTAVYDGIVEICCQALADFARREVIEDWRQLDFNVSDLLDDVEVVKNRDKYIRSIIEQSA